jgi:hypothetical protein
MVNRLPIGNIIPVAASPMLASSTIAGAAIGLSPDRRAQHALQLNRRPSGSEHRSRGQAGST